MGLLKDFKKMKEDLAEIKAALSKDYINKANRLEEVEGYLSNISLKVKSIANVLDENGKPALKIVYEIPSVLLTFDDNGEVMLNEMFRSINGLDLIDMSDKLLILENINKKKI